VTLGQTWENNPNFIKQQKKGFMGMRGSVAADGRG